MSQAYATTRQQIVPAKQQEANGKVIQTESTSARNANARADGPVSGKTD